MYAHGRVVAVILLVLLTVLPVDTYSHLDPPGNPPIRVEVKVLDVELLTDQDDGLNGETELIVSWTLAHLNHPPTRGSKVGGVLNLIFNYDYIEQRRKQVDSVLYSHIECSPMSTIFLTAEFVEDDTDTMTQILSGAFAALTGLGATLVTLGSGGSLLVVTLASGSALSSIVSLASSVNGNDYLGSSAIAAGSPGRYTLASKHVAMDIEITVTPVPGEGSCDIPRGIRQVTTQSPAVETTTRTITVSVPEKATVTYTTTVETTVTVTTLISETAATRITPQTAETSITITYEEAPGLTTSTTIDPILRPLIEKSQKELERNIEEYSSKDRAHFELYKHAIALSLNIMPEEGNPGNMTEEQVNMLRRTIPVKMLLEGLDPLVLDIVELASTTSSGNEPINAIRYLSTARDDVKMERYLNAVDNYNLAWEESIKAILGSRCPCSEARTTANTLSIRILDETMNPVEGLRVDVYGDRGLILTTTTEEEPKTVVLESGEYMIKASVDFLGRPFTVGSTSIDLKEPSEVTLIVSSIIVPVKWMPTIGDAVGALIASIIAFKLYSASRGEESKRGAGLTIAIIIGIAAFALLHYVI